MQNTSTSRSTDFRRRKTIASKTPLTLYGRGFCASDRTPTTTGSPAGRQSNQNVWVLPPISRNAPALCVRSTTPPSQPRTTEEAPVWPTGHNHRSRVFYTAGVRHKRNGRQGVRTIPENVVWTSGGEEWRPPLFSGDEPSAYKTDDVHPPMEYHVFSWLPFIIHPKKVESVCNSVPSSLPKINFDIFLSEMLQFFFLLMLKLLSLSLSLSLSFVVSVCSFCFQIPFSSYFYLFRFFFFFPLIYLRVYFFMFSVSVYVSPL